MRGFMEYFSIVRRFNRNAHLFLVHTLLFGLAIALLALLYNLYILSLGFQEDMIGTVTLAACMVAVVAALPLGFVLNRLGYKQALLFAVLMTATSIVLPLLSPTREALIACELFWGVGFTLLIIAGGPFMTDNSDKDQRTHLFSIQFVLTMLTAFVGNLLGGELPRFFAGVFEVGAETPQAYQGALAVSAGLMLASAVPLLFLQKRTSAHATAARPRLTIRHRTQTAKLLAPYVIGALAAGMFVPFANVLWKTTQNVSDATIGNIFAAAALAIALCGVLTPYFTHRFGAVRVMVVAQTASVVGLLAFGFSPIFGIALAGYLARDVLMNLTRPLMSQFMMDRSEPVERAAVSALATMGFNLAWGISSWVSGAWQTQNQLPLMFAVSAGFFLISAGALQWMFGRTRARQDVDATIRPIGVRAEEPVT